MQENDHIYLFWKQSVLTLVNKKNVLYIYNETLEYNHAWLVGFGVKKLSHASLEQNKVLEFCYVFSRM